MPPPEGVAALEAELENHHLTATTLMASCRLASEDAVERFHGALHTANRLGTGIIFVSVKSEGTPLDVIYGRLKRLGDEAADHGVKIAIETHPDLADNGRVAR